MLNFVKHNLASLILVITLIALGIFAIVANITPHPSVPGLIIIILAFLGIILYPAYSKIWKK